MVADAKMNEHQQFELHGRITRQWTGECYIEVFIDFLPAVSNSHCNMKFFPAVTMANKISADRNEELLPIIRTRSLSDLRY